MFDAVRSHMITLLANVLLFPRKYVILSEPATDTSRARTVPFTNHEDESGGTTRSAPIRIASCAKYDPDTTISVPHVSKSPPMDACPPKIDNSPLLKNEEFIQTSVIVASSRVHIFASLDGPRARWEEATRTLANADGDETTKEGPLIFTPELMVVAPVNKVVPWTVMLPSTLRSVPSVRSFVTVTEPSHDTS